MRVNLKKEGRQLWGHLRLGDRPFSTLSCHPSSPQPLSVRFISWGKHEAEKEGVRLRGFRARKYYDSVKVD